MENTFWKTKCNLTSEWHYLGYLHGSMWIRYHLSLALLIIGDECPYFFPWRICKVAGQVWYMAIRLWWGSVARRSFDWRSHWGVGYATPSKYVVFLGHMGLIRLNFYLKQKDKKVVFVTNNATKSRRSYKSKFDQLGVQAHVVGGRPSLHCCRFEIVLLTE